MVTNFIFLQNRFSKILKMKIAVICENFQKPKQNNKYFNEKSNSPFFKLVFKYFIVLIYKTELLSNKLKSFNSIQVKTN